ncbi:Emopamil-binding protein [Thamnidium elegans]|nr:Emopamil-binding protein [Thamnidium elegans]
MTGHPYYPTDAEIPHYVPNDRSTTELLVIAGGIMTSLVGLCFIGSRTLSKKTSSVSRLTWFFISGILHVGFESYWLWYRASIAGRNDILAQLWKEYAHGDSRYLVADELLLTLEVMTIFIWGPLCLITCWYILNGSPKQYFFQLVASLCHLFSCSLYFIMDLPEATHCNPSPYYFYIYFISFNMPWLIVPFTLLCQSYQHITKSLMLKTKIQ